MMRRDGFFFNDTATAEIYTSVNTLSLHDALPILAIRLGFARATEVAATIGQWVARSEEHTSELQSLTDISYAVFCLQKKKKKMRAALCDARRAADDDAGRETAGELVAFECDYFGAGRHRL